MQERDLIISEIMMPNQANVEGNIHGGEIMKIMDSCAYAVTRRYARTNVVTARVDELQFHQPIKVGDLVICSAKIVFAGRSSMEVHVKVLVEDLRSHTPPIPALSAFFTMVALDRNSKPAQIFPLEINTPEEKAAFEAGKARYDSYKAKRRCEKKETKA
ncbi:acyl-CoA thioesterase [Pectinatus haikarae]|uniref:Acyl-CoA hydrolase n=1 Tax=Pectinatus haikarae TaxID=349096 RepID=A0ABT9Y7N2_9FIRM|nr:acyl-CoA thioesterase [Pectinatus haikarae]MDQ0203845.1 acyl-CoA hydrolase [Pectinatus haikarae]